MRLGFTWSSHFPLVTAHSTAPAMNQHLIVIMALCGLVLASEMNNGAIRLSFTADQAAAANRMPLSSVDLLQRKVFSVSPAQLQLRDNAKIVAAKAYGNLDNPNGGQRMLVGCSQPNCKGLNSVNNSDKVNSNGSSSGGAVERAGRPSRMDLLSDDEQSRKYEQCKQMLLNLPPISHDQPLVYNRPPVYNVKVKSDSIVRTGAELPPPVEPDEDVQPSSTRGPDEVFQSQIHKYKLSLTNILKDLGVVCANGTKLKGTSGVNLHIHLPYPACRQTRSSGGGRGEVARALVGEAGLTLTYRTVSKLNPRGQRSPIASNRGDSDLEITLLNDSVVIPLNHTRLPLTRNKNVRPMKPIGQMRPNAERQPFNVDETQINGLLESLGNIIQSSSFTKQGEIIQMNLADDRTWAQVNNGSGHSHWGH